MGMLAKMERDRTLADLANVDEMLAALSDSDFVSRATLQQRRDELLDQVAQYDDRVEDGTASAALFFGGRPVIADRGIEAEFAGEISRSFQDLIAKFAAQSVGQLGRRGVVPRKEESTLHITNVVRGSFGFLFEQAAEQREMVPTLLSDTVRGAAKLLSAYSSEDDENFAAQLEEVDQRVLEAAAGFFDLIQKSGATFRLVAGNSDNSYGSAAIERAVERAKESRVELEINTVEAIFLGGLPESHRFELKLAENEELMTGRIDPELSSNDIQRFNRDFTNSQVFAQIETKKILRNGAVVRESYTLKRLNDAAEAGQF
ncbi:hypothetical protein [Henriciella marina]|uniref:hypothetical protein n=1 Tax=Henriciella marina TaxID=453851 RepID=UPI0012EAB170|nr:hypothetical protein [Henriciella marina]